MKNLRTEEEIISTWNTLEPVVSICCTAFNQEAFIRETIESFLQQQTSFPFEIILHDDASTDQTKKIILEYKNIFPNIIKVILQEENQYIINGHIPFFNTWNKAKGKYIALCEGDDYWISKNKLQTQVTLMKQYPDINISFHPAYQVNGVVLNKGKLLCDYGDEVKIFSPEQVILGGGEFMPTASIMVKAKILHNLPEWFSKYAPVGDMYIQILSSLQKGALFFPQIGSIYRQNIKGSWSSQQNRVARKSLIARAEGQEKCLIALNSLCDGNYDKSIYSAIAIELVGCSVVALKNNYFDLFEIFLDKSLLYKTGVNKNHIILNTFRKFPNLLARLIIIKDRLRQS